jgi:hypothetical protein
LVFMSGQDLTGGNRSGDEEVYVYEADNARLTCVSCSASGEQPPTTTEGAAGFLRISYDETYLPRPISDEGGKVRVFFDSAVPLVPQDTNGVQDVYEWEDGGRGSCQVASGCTYLLTGGSNHTDSWLLDASENGNDVFLVTRAQLTPEDDNESFNLFDARVDGVSPVTPPACTGTGCQGVPESPPVFATPPSVTFAGVGNFASPVTTVVKAKAKPLTRAQKLEKALKACARERKKLRPACEAQARKRYGAKKKAKKTSSAKGRK